MIGRGPGAWVLVFGLAVSAVSQAAAPAVAQAEVEYLLAAIAQSGCQFNRNGTWYDGTRAVANLQSKYSYLVMRDAIRTADDFIEMAASRSSVTGSPYWISCSGATPIQSGQWLKDQLTAYRHPNSVPSRSGP